ncbi:hypothetical protein K450DRAFT_221313 [Umbelopsis ramanniana AG]|uniref:AB hydrolase-1 domain-containing protein n=1 Tax=Umbelopsis ramanniana AG TaxID=1314678 RepID=A0AAD5EKI4_UMBRA|nr:uncharacterized protein K450DRAFT_221313 [Umbelopsis ramanniana AG]KAI8584065.1 hypothetical protein K450DRAFT_221313 [Umbelopsis ramanniana AG]
MSSVQLHHSDHPVSIKPVNTGAEISLVDYLAKKCPSLVGPNAFFRPTLFLPNGHLQTFWAAYYNATETHNKVEYERQHVATEDGGTFTLDWAPPFSEMPVDNTPTLVVLHGLTGGSHESYIRSLLAVVTKAPFNYRAVVFNARGCANSELKTPRLFNGARTDDLRTALIAVQEKLGTSTPLVGIGFSLGSNILVKYLGEEGDKTPLIAGVSVGNPFDFLNSSMHLERSWFRKTIYSGTMAGNLKRAFNRHATMLSKDPSVDAEKVQNAQTIREFDDLVTRPMGGYDTVNDYYRDASSSVKVKKVRVPLLCFNAMDDPISPAESIPYDEIKINPNVVLATTQHGGHLGWFEGNWSPTRWIVKPLTEFIVAMFEAYDEREAARENQLTPQAVDDAVYAAQALE